MNERTALVTGASTGIGAATARGLAARGYTVFAGVRREEDANAIKAERVEPVILDVTDTASIAAARDRVLAQTNGRLDALVNNAGIVVYSPLEFVPLDTFREQFEVNVVGPLAMAQAFLPALREARGRIINIGSISGRFVAPFGGPYSASKFALRALNDVLRLELHPFGIEVSLIAPGAVATPIWAKSSARAQALIAQQPPRAMELYGRAMRALGASMRGTPKAAADPEAVVDAVVRALWAPRPRAEYIVGRDAQIFAVIASLPARVRERIVRRFMEKAEKALDANPPDGTTAPVSAPQTQS